MSLQVTQESAGHWTVWFPFFYRDGAPVSGYIVGAGPTEQAARDEARAFLLRSADHVCVPLGPGAPDPRD